MSAAVSENSTGCLSEGHFTQYMADNMDHNTATLDGLKTFHGMGIICAVTPAVSSKLVVKRRTNIKVEEITEKAKIDIKYYREECKGLLKVKFEELKTTLMAGFTKSGSRDNFNFKSSAFLPYAILLCFLYFFTFICN